MTYQAVVRHQTFAQSPGSQEYHVESTSYGETCGHAHADVRDADRCVNGLAASVQLGPYDAVIVRAMDGSPLDVADKALLYGLYAANRKAGWNG